MTELPPDPTDTGVWSIQVNPDTGDVDVAVQQPVGADRDGEVLARSIAFSLRPDSAYDFFRRGLIETLLHYPALRPEL